EVGAEGERHNEVIEAVYVTAQKAREEAPDAPSRDLGIVAAGRMAIHYWTAAFDTARGYLDQLGMDESAAAMQKCLEEAQQQDVRHVELANRMTSATS
ncbi:DUF892 family protein, partial [Rubrivirga sp.]|uniref:DUF892 family protein n=1 Tax=Rubrivirga sp. TaxID=1885344 RepID=UPI003C788F4E